MGCISHQMLLLEICSAGHRWVNQVCCFTPVSQISRNKQILAAQAVPLAMQHAAADAITAQPVSNTAHTQT